MKVKYSRSLQLIVDGLKSVCRTLLRRDLLLPMDVECIERLGGTST